MKKILAKAPETSITDCMSCRLQFQHELPHTVFHQIKILTRAYLNWRSSLNGTDSGEDSSLLM